MGTSDQSGAAVIGLDVPRPVGVGIRVHAALEIQDGELTAMDVFADGPANKGGLLAGDVILLGRPYIDKKVYKNPESSKSS